MPFYFDLSPRGAAGDADALAFVVAERPLLGGRSVPTPPLLFMTPEGDVLAEISNYATEDQVLAVMLKVLGEHPEYAEPDEAEQHAESAVERARIELDLQQYDRAKELLQDEPGDEAAYLLAHIARLERDWDAFERHAARVTGESLRDDLRMERAYRSWLDADYESLLEQVAGFSASSNRYTEARYYEGLAMLHLGDEQEALRIWKETILGRPQDPWIYRADWAYTGLVQKAQRVFSAGNRGASLLNRIGYMGRQNPDLSGPARAN